HGLFEDVPWVLQRQELRIAKPQFRCTPPRSRLTRMSALVVASRGATGRSAAVSAADGMSAGASFAVDASVVVDVSDADASADAPSRATLASVGSPLPEVPSSLASPAARSPAVSVAPP